MDTETPKRYRPGIHVHLYFWVALVTVSLVPFLILSTELYEPDHVPERVSAFLSLVIGFQYLLWLARRRCSTSELGVWDGWLYVTGYMTIGVGWASFILAIAGTAAAVLLTAGIALLSLFESDPAKAQQRFLRMVSWFGRHRMYQ
jgi:hypothetical protein